MNERRRAMSSRVCLGLLCAAMLAGCTPLRVPAIDPTGRRLFAPHGSYTTLVPPALLPCAPEPAFSCPPTPPPCEPTPPACPPLAGPAASTPLTLPPPPIVAQPAAAPLGTGCLDRDGRQGQLMLAPQRMMAPVGSEVVIVSGLYGERHTFVPRQTIEWTFAPDSVGQIVDSNEGRRCIKRLFREAAHERTGQRAVTETVAEGQVLTRGTPSPADDMAILPGQSWLSITSPSEGVSHVTVLAPEAENWDRRRQTATIYWVDVQWLLPAPAVVPASQPHSLSVTLRRASGKPLPGWLVRYELTGGADVSTFGPDRQAAKEVPTDQNGVATIGLAAAKKSGSSQILIKIIRPANSADDLPAMVVGQGWTTVTWSAPDPKVTVTGPEQAGLGTPIQYRADVTNAGDVVARQVVASTTVPANMTYIQSEPPATVIGNALTWKLGDLAPGAGRSIRISLRPETNAPARFCVRIDSDDVLEGRKLSAEACVNTRVFSSSLAMRVNWPQTAQVGQTVTCEIELANKGAEPLNNVRIRDRLPVGLDHPTQPGRMLERALGEPLPPGASRKIAVELVVKQAGKLCHNLDAFADGGHTATAAPCLEATQPPPPAPPPQLRPAAQATVQGPDESFVGQQVVYVLHVANIGTAPLTNVRIVAATHNALTPRDATSGFDENLAGRTGELAWIVASLQPGETVTREIKCDCTQEAAAAVCRLSVETAETRTLGEKATRIRPRRSPAVPGGVSRSPSGQPEPNRLEPSKPEAIAGDLQVSLADVQDPIAVGGTTTYYLMIENARNVSDKNVTATITLPAGMEFVKISGPAAQQNRSPDQRTIQLTVAELRAREKTTFSLETRGRQIGKHTVKVKVDSFRSSQPIEREADTTVNVSG